VLELNSALRDALQAAADDEVTIHPLWTAGGAARPGADASGTVPSARVPSVVTQPPALLTSMPALPPAAGSPAQTAPLEVGRDPFLVHVWLARLQYPARSLQLYIASGQESIRVDGGDADGRPAAGFFVQVGRTTTNFDPLTGTRRSVTVGDHPAVAGLETIQGRLVVTVRWQPAANLWAQVSGGMDLTMALAIAADVRLDQVHRCVVPMRLTAVPTGTVATSCNVTFAATSVDATVGVRVDGWDVAISVAPGTVQHPNEVLGGRPAYVLEHPGDGGARIMEVTVDCGDQIVANLTAEGHYDSGSVRSMAANVVPVRGTNMADWPTTPLP